MGIKQGFPIITNTSDSLEQYNLNSNKHCIMTGNPVIVTTLFIAHNSECRNYHEPHRSLCLFSLARVRLAKLA